MLEWLFLKSRAPPLDFPNLNQLEEVFLDKAPQIRDFRDDKAKSSGKGFGGLCEKVYLQWHHYFTNQSEQDPTKSEIRKAEFLTSRMADREFQEGEYVYLQEGEIFQVDKIAVREGGYIAVLKNIDEPSRVKIVCRGTAMRRTATDGLKTGLNDLQYEIGNGGVQACWPIISTYLTQHNVTEAEIYGKSLGGAHAQRLAILVMKLSACQLVGLTTVCSVGVGPEAEAIFKNLVEANPRYHNLKLTVIRNGGHALDQGADYIPCIGGDHLGSTVDSRYLNLQLYYIHRSAEQQIFPPEDGLNIAQKGYRFISSFLGPHVWQTTLEDFSYLHVENRESVRLALKLGASLERARRWIAYRKPISFSDFAHQRLVSTASTTTEKTIVVASTIFLLLFMGGFIMCCILCPGNVVYQGSGIVLNLPAIIMAGGAGLSLTVIAISSYLWCSSSRTRQPSSIHY